MYGKPKILLFLLRVGMGWIFFYSGITKIFDSKWSSKSFLLQAKTFPELFRWFASPANIGWVDFLNKWGELAIGAALILGVFMGIAAFSGILLMVLYYLPGLSFPFVGTSFYIVDEHIIYILVLLLLARLKAGKIFGLSQIFGRAYY